MKKVETHFELLLYTQLFSRIGFQLSSFSSTHSKQWSTFFKFRDGSYYIDSDRLSLNPYQKDIYPLLTLLSSTETTQPKQSLRLSFERFTKRTKKKAVTASSPDLTVLFDPVFKQSLLSKPIETYQKLYKHDLRQLVETLYEQLHHCLSSLLIRLKACDGMDIVSLMTVLKSSIDRLKQPNRFQLDQCEQLCKLNMKFVDMFLTVFNLTAIQEHCKPNAFSSIAVERVLASVSSVMLMINYTQSIYIYVQLFKIHVFLGLTQFSKPNAVSDQEHQFFTNQLSKLYETFSFHEGPLCQFNQQLETLSQVCRDLSLELKKESSTDDSVALYKQVLTCDDQLQDTLQHLKLHFFDGVFNYLITAYRIEKALYRSLSERFILDMFERLTWSDMIESVLSRLKLILADIDLVLNSFDQSVLNLSDVDVDISESMKHKLTDLLVSLESIFSVLGLLFICHFRLNAYMFQRQMILALQQHIDATYLTPFSSLYIQLFCLSLPAKTVTEFFQGGSFSCSKQTIRQLIASAVSLRPTESYHSFFKNGEDWWNSYFFVNQWSTATRQVLFSMPETCWRVLLTDWSVTTLYHSQFLNELLTYYKTHQKEKFIFDLFVHLLDQPSSSRAQESDDLLKLLYLKSKEFDFKHARLESFSIYFLVYIDQLKERSTLINTLYTDFQFSQSKLLILKLSQFFDDCITLTVTENDYVFMYIIKQVGYDVVVDYLFKIAHLELDLFNKYTSFFAMYFFSDSEFIKAFLDAFSTHHIDSQLYHNLQKTFKSMWLDGHFYSKKLAVQVNDILHFSDSIEPVDEGKSTVVLYDIMAEYSQDIVTILKNPHEYLASQATVTTLEHQSHVRHLLDKTLADAMCFLPELLGNELGTVLTHVKHKDQSSIKHIETIRSMVVGSSQLSLQQQVLSFQLLFLISYAYIDSFFESFNSDVLLFVSLFKKPFLFNDANADFFVQHIIPFIMISRHSDHVVNFLFAALEDIRQHPDRASNETVLISLLNSSLDFVMSLDNRQQLDYPEFKHAIEKMLDLLLVVFQQKQTLDSYIIHHLIPCIKSLFECSLIELQHPFIQWFQKTVLSNSEDHSLARSFNDQCELVSELIAWLNLPFNDLVLLDDDAFFSSCDRFKQNQYCFSYLFSFSIMLVYKYAGVLLVRLKTCESKQNQQDIVYMLNVIFSSSYTLLDWKNLRLLREFMSDFFVNDQFSYFMHLFYFESSLDEQLQFFELLCISPTFLKQQLMSLYQSGQLISDSNQHDVMVAILDQVIKKTLEPERHNRVFNSVQLIDTLLAFKTTLSDGRVNDLFQVEALSKQLFEDLCLGLNVTVMLQRLQHLFSFFVSNNVDNSYCDVSDHSERVVFSDVEWLCRCVVDIKEHPKVDSILSDVLDRALFNLLHCWLYAALTVSYSSSYHIKSSTFMTQLIFSYSHHQDIVKHVLSHVALDQFCVSRFVELFSDDLSGKKDQLLFFLFQEYRLFESFSAPEFSHIFHKLHQLGYSKAVLSNVITLLSSPQIFFNLCQFDLGFALFLFDKETLFLCVTKEDFLDFCSTNHHAAVLYDLIYQDGLVDGSDDSILDIFSKSSFKKLILNTKQLSSQQLNELAYCLFRLFSTKSLYTGPILTLLFCYQPHLFWTVILESKYHLTSLFIQFLVCQTTTHRHLNDVLIYDWLNHDVFKFYFDQQLTSLSSLVSRHSMPTSILFYFVQKNPSWLTYVSHHNVADFIVFCINQRFTTLFNHQFNLIEDVFSTSLFDLVFNFNQDQYHRTYVMLLGLTYLSKQDFFRVIHFIESNYVLKINTIITRLLNVFVQLKLTHRLAFIYRYFQPFLHSIDSTVLESLNQYEVTHHAHYSALCYTTDLMFEDQIDILKQCDYLPMLMSKTYLNQLGASLLDHKDSTYLLDVAVNNPMLFKSILLTERFATSLSHAMTYSTFQTDFTLYHQVEKMLSQFNYFESSIFVFHYLKGLLLPDQLLRLKRLICSTVQQALVEDFVFQFENESFHKEILNIINYPIQKVSTLDPLLKKVVSHLFSKDVFQDATSHFLSYLMSLTANQSFDSYQKEYAYKKIDALARTSSGRHDMYVFLHFQHHLWELDLLDVFIRDWDTQNSIYDLLALHSNRLQDTIILADILDGLVDYVRALDYSQYSEDQFNKLLHIAAFLLAKSSSQALLMTWIQTSLFNTISDKHVPELSMFLDVSAVSDDALFSFVSPVISTCSFDVALLFFDRIRLHPLFLRFLQAYIDSQDIVSFSTMLNQPSSQWYQFSYKYLVELIDAKHEFIFECCDIYASYELSLDAYFPDLFERYFNVHSNEDTKEDELPKNNVIDLVQHAIEMKHEAFLSFILRFASYCLLTKKQSVLWLFNQFFALYSITLDDFDNSSLTHETVLHGLFLLRQARLIDADGYMLKPLFSPIQKDKFLIHLNQTDWSSELDLFYVSLHHILVSKSQQRQFMMTLFMNIAPELVSHFSADEQLFNHVNEDIKLARPESLTSLIFSSYSDSSFYKMVLNDMMDHVVDDNDYTLFIYQQFSSLSEQRCVQYLVDPMLTVKTRDNLCYGLMINQSNQDSFGYSKKWIYLVLTLFQTEIKKDNQSSIKSDILVPYLEIMLFFFFHFPLDVCHLIDESFSDLKQVLSLDFHVLFQCKAAMEELWSHSVNQSDTVIDQFRDVVTTLKSNRYSLFEIISSYRMTSFFDQQTYETYIVDFFDDYVTADFATQYVPDRQVLKLSSCLCSGGKLDTTAAEFWSPIEYGSLFKTWLEKYNLIDSRGLCTLTSLADLSAYITHSTLYLSFVDKESEYYFKLIENPDYLMAESKLYFDKFFNILNHETQLTRLDVLSHVLLMRRLSVEFGYFSSFSLDVTWLETFLKLFDHTDVMALLDLGYTTLIYNIFKPYLRFTGDQLQLESVSQWISHVSVFVTVEDLINQNIKSSDATVFHRYLVAQEFLDSRGRLLKEITQHRVYDVSSFSIQKNKSYSESFHHIIASKRHSLLTVIQIQLFISHLFDSAGRFSERCFVQFMQQLTESDWFFVKVLLVQPIQHFDSLFDCIHLSIKTIDSSFVLKDTYASFSKAAELISKRQENKTDKIQHIFSTSTIQSKPNSVGLSELMERVGTV